MQASGASLTLSVKCPVSQHAPVRLRQQDRFRCSNKRMPPGDRASAADCSLDLEAPLLAFVAHRIIPENRRPAHFRGAVLCGLMR
jgi:hypothetical protein